MGVILRKCDFMKKELSNKISEFSFRKKILAFADCFICIFTALISNFILSFFDKSVSILELMESLVVGSICFFSALFMFGAYNKLWRYFSGKDYLSCLYGTITGSVAENIIIVVMWHSIRPLYALIQMILFFIGICAFRYIFKATFITLVRTGQHEVSLKRTMIIGAGEACRILLRELENSRTKNEKFDENAAAEFEPVCIIDDDTSKLGTLVRGIPVLGVTSAIHKYVEQEKIEQIIFAIPSCIDDEQRRILDICSSTSLPIKILPFIGNLIFEENSPILLAHIRNISVEDLLGREPIKFDNQEVCNIITHKVCMVTGGGGSIGSELVRQIAKYDPEQIIIVDIYENSAYEIQQELIMEYGKSINLITLIASVSDYFRMNQIFRTYRPEVVFHAAAHKHVPLMEDSPMEAIKNNVMGTLDVATLAQFYGTEKFVMISTDKAVNPTNVMGASKRCCEMIVQFLSQQNEGITEFVTTRFGNVLGSNGSVIPLFKKQIEQGKPVTVTHPDIIRYFMTIPEAVSLVLEATSMARGGEIYVLDMGKPVRIVTLAENLIRMYGKVPYRDVQIKFTGLRPGEKIREELLMNEEGLMKTSNDLIYIGKQIDIDEADFILKLRQLKEAAFDNDESLVLSILHDIVPTFIEPEIFNKSSLAV